MNITDHAKNKKDQLLLLFADAEKAFDCIDWKFMKCVLRRMGVDINLRQ